MRCHKPSFCDVTMGAVVVVAYDTYVTPSYYWPCAVTMICTTVVYHSAVQATADYGPFSAYWRLLDYGA